MSLQDIIDLSTKEEITGDLCLIICCRKCDATFELNTEVIALAMITNASVWDYIKAVQNTKCRVCNSKENN